MRILLALLLLTSSALAGGGPLALGRPQWTPRNLRGIAAWWDGQYGASGTITVSDISKFSGGNDMTASSHQPTLVANQANGYQVIHFTNTPTILYMSCASPITIGQNWYGCTVARLSGPAAAGQIMADSVSNIQVFAFTTGNVMDANDVLQLRQSSSAPTVSSFCLLEYLSGSGVASFLRNAVDQGRSGSGTFSANMHFNTMGMVLASAAGLNGDVATAFICTVNHDGTFAQKQAQEYCRRRFALY